MTFFWFDELRSVFVVVVGTDYGVESMRTRLMKAIGDDSKLFVPEVIV